MTATLQPRDRFLRRLGAEVRALREQRDLTRSDLAEASGLSVRYLASLETGRGNISVARLASVAEALETRPSRLLAVAESGTARPLLALLGLRGAGKSTLGPKLAEALDVPFFELDQLIERTAGMELAQIFELHGERYYRRIEREALAGFFIDNPRAVLATGGGIVSEAETYTMLRQHTTTIWLKAAPQDHWDRVVAQGDRRPMANHARAMEELRQLLQAREALYAEADLIVDTSTLSVDEAVREVSHKLGLG